jgi:hypothetical protein
VLPQIDLYARTTGNASVAPWRRGKIPKHHVATPGKQEATAIDMPVEP